MITTKFKNGIISIWSTTIFGQIWTKNLAAWIGNAGKTSILCKLKFGNVSYVKLTTLPTKDFNVDTIEHNRRKFKVYDLGGQSKLRTLWQHYLKDTKGIIFVIDSHPQYQQCFTVWWMASKVKSRRMGREEKSWTWDLTGGARHQVRGGAVGHWDEDAGDEDKGG